MTEEPKFERINDFKFKIGSDVFIIDQNGFDIFKGFVLGSAKNIYKILFTETKIVEDIHIDRIIPNTPINEEIFDKQEKVRRKIEIKHKKDKIMINLEDIRKNDPFFRMENEPMSESTSSDSSESDDNFYTIDDIKKELNMIKTEDDENEDEIRPENLPEKEEKKDKITQFKVSSCEYNYRVGKDKSTWTIHLRFA